MKMPLATGIRRQLILETILKNDLTRFVERGRFPIRSQKPLRFVIIQAGAAVDVRRIGRDPKGSLDCLPVDLKLNVVFLGGAAAQQRDQ